MQISTGTTMRNAAKAIARQIPSINALIKQRDALLRENAALKQQMRASALTPPPAGPTAYQPHRRKHFVHDYQTFVRHLIATYPIDEAMSMAVGGAYDTIGSIEVAILRACGLQETHSLIDLGCGSGRLAKHIGTTFPSLNYFGIDVVPELLAYAATQSRRHFRFVEHHDVGFPRPTSLPISSPPSACLPISSTRRATSICRMPDGCSGRAAPSSFRSLKRQATGRFSKA
jgi:hypothetical protein